MKLPYCSLHQVISHFSLNAVLGWGFPGGAVVKNLPVQETQETWVQSLGWERSPGEGNGNPFQYSCLENHMDIGIWQSMGSQRVRFDGGHMYYMH